MPPTSLSDVRHDLTVGRTDYWDLLHRPDGYYHRLDPKYMLNWHSYNSYYPYMYRHPVDVRRDSDRLDGFGKSMNTFKQQIDREALEVRNKREYDLFARDRQADIRLDPITSTPPLYLTPSRLYDNPDYRQLRRQSRMG